jgi:hypothetical protein
VVPRAGAEAVAAPTRLGRPFDRSEMTHQKTLHRGRHGGQTGEADNSIGMQPGARIAAGIGVLIGGVTLAILFRHPAPPGAAPPAPEGAALVLREHLAPPQPREAVVEAAATQGAPRRQEIESPQTAPPAGTVVASDPPLLAREYPGTLADASAVVGSLWPGPAAPGGSGPRPARHTVIDGDRLDVLAARYLGDADLAMDLFEANRDVLVDPNVLPIGVELAIPPERPMHGPNPADSAPPATAAGEPPRRLVPVRTAAP